MRAQTVRHNNEIQDLKREFRHEIRQLAAALGQQPSIQGGGQPFAAATLGREVASVIPAPTPIEIEDDVPEGRQRRRPVSERDRIRAAENQEAFRMELVGIDKRFFCFEDYWNWYKNVAVPNNDKYGCGWRNDPHAVMKGGEGATNKANSRTQWYSYRIFLWNFCIKCQEQRNMTEEEAVAFCSQLFNNVQPSRRTGKRNLKKVREEFKTAGFVAARRGRKRKRTEVAANAT